MTRRSLDESNPLIGRFDQSFLIHMIRDFFVLLVLVTVLEFALKAGMVYYSFRTEGPDTAREVAADIAANVRSIMRNEGGPVAARTVYPILQTQLERPRLPHRHHPLAGDDPLDRGGVRFHPRRRPARRVARCRQQHRHPARHRRAVLPVVP
ncbi:MAG: hypothetical protein U5K36_11320 [Roseovarius sp.]|nr:hypothetical protein [Roseovarius sp.]